MIKFKCDNISCQLLIIMKLKIVLLVFVSSFLGAGIALIGKSLFAKEPLYIEKSGQAYGRFASYRNSLGDDVFVAAAEKSVKAVVHIRTRADYPEHAIFEFLRNKQDESFTLGNGSGVIISENGYIITNNHVIDQAKMIEVVLNDKRKFKATLVGTDPTTDIALLKINADQLPCMSIGSSDEMKIGEWVLAVGNPFNLTSTVTAGIVSAKGRDIHLLETDNSIESFIQTDAVVNPGNSGGALVNLKGELIGINTAIASPTGVFAGYSFAVPIDIAQKVVKDIIEYGSVQRGLLGVELRDVDADLARKNKLDRLEGVFVAGVDDNGAAKDAGIHTGDLILKIEDRMVSQVTDLRENIGRYHPGDQVSLTLRRNGSEMQVKVILRNSKGSIKIIPTENFEKLGIKIQSLSTKELEDLGIVSGIKVVEIEAGKFLKAGVRPGFIITKINKSTIKSVDDFRNLCNSLKGGVIVEGIYQKGSIEYYAIGL